MEAPKEEGHASAEPSIISFSSPADNPNTVGPGPNYAKASDHKSDEKS